MPAPVRPPARRHYTPPEVAKLYCVATAKVIGWIRSGELAALNLANRGCKRPRYSISPAALEAFERARAVVPAAQPQQRVRRRTPPTREYV